VLNTIGDHIRKRRLELKLLQREVGEALGVTDSSVWNWENNWSKPRLSYLPGIIAFLGYNPAPKEPRTLGEKLLRYRQERGLTQKDLARQIGIDPGTLSRMEGGRERSFRSTLEKVSLFLRVQRR